MKIIKIVLAALIASTLFTACGDDDDDNNIGPVTPGAGPGGQGEISVYARFGNILVPGAKIYIEYGATEFPGTHTILYDATETCDSTGQDAGHTLIENLHQGAYYLYVIGYDSTTASTVSGHMGVVLETENDYKEVNILLD